MLESVFSFSEGHLKNLGDVDSPIIIENNLSGLNGFVCFICCLMIHEVTSHDTS